MKSRSVLNRCWAAISILWITWCFYWPYYARQQDQRALDADLAETYSLCLQQQGMTPATCEADRAAYKKLDESLAWPPDQNAYQVFAGRKMSDAISLLTVLCLLPIVFGYALVRGVFEATIWCRSRFTNAPGSRSARTTLPEFHQPAATNPPYDDQWEVRLPRPSLGAIFPDTKP